MRIVAWHRKTRLFLTRFFLLNIFLLCSEPFQAQTPPNDTTIILNQTKVDILFPKGMVRGTILLLPGWNFSRKKTCEQSDFCTQAKNAGFILICPEMGKSLYASTAYPESRKDWIGFPQLRFITDTLEPYIQHTFGVLKPGQKNFIYGISTGSRGGALILEHADSLYTAAALLSGDYNQLLDTQDNLMKGYYGDVKQFKSRWEGADNPSFHVDKIKAAIYLGHGKKDAVVPFAQSQSFYQLLVKNKITVQFSSPEEAGHNYNFWSTQTDTILKFFIGKL
jgi:S-formylglutathione hydrolase FrmB